MMTRKRVLVFAVVLVVLGVGALAAWQYRMHQMRVRFAQWRAEGMAASLAGDHDQAVRRLEPYLRRNTNDAEALWRYIESRPKAPLPKQRQLRETVSAARRYLRMDPERTEVYRVLAELHLALDERTEAIETAKG